jgi:hypothetical protein
MKCTCPEHSPFRWAERTTPSIFANDPMFKAKGDDLLSTGHIMTEVVKRKRKANVNHGTIYGLNKDREEAITKAKRFHVYSRAGTK